MCTEKRPCENMVNWQCLQTKERGLMRNPTCQHINLELVVATTVRNQISIIYATQWYFVTVDLANKFLIRRQILKENLKSRNKKRWFSCIQGIFKRLTADFSVGTREARWRWEDMFTVLKKKTVKQEFHVQQNLF